MTGLGSGRVVWSSEFSRFQRDKSRSLSKLSPIHGAKYLIEILISKSEGNMHESE